MKLGSVVSIVGGTALLVLAYGAPAQALSYGTFVGTWDGNATGEDTGPYTGTWWLGNLGTDCGTSAYDNNQVECLIRQAYDGTPNASQDPFSDLGLPRYADGTDATGDEANSDIYNNQLHPVGKVDEVADEDANGTFIDNLLRIEFGDTTDSGTWTYWPDDVTNSDARPTEDEVIDFYLILKYGLNFSIWYYDNVAKGDTGLFSLDPSVNGADTSFGGGTGYCETLANQGDKCIVAKYNESNDSWNPQGMSHIVGLWPAGDEVTDAPEPATLALFGLGLLGLGALRRRRAA